MSTTVQEWHFGRTDEMPDGPWKNEPDKLHWIDEATGLDCLIVRNRSGALCGYVGLPPGHPQYGKDYDDVQIWSEEGGSWPDVHGGLTFASSCNETNPDGICHVPAAGRPKDVWWLGFDCAHCGDLDPLSLKFAAERNFEYPFLDPRREDVYRDVEYVKAECASLARQLAATA